MMKLGDLWIDIIDGQEHVDLIKDVETFLEWVDKHYYTKIVITRANTDGLNGYGRFIKHYFEFYILCERCHKCGWVPVVHGDEDNMFHARTLAGQML